jgi:hypothetical protein
LWGKNLYWINSNEGNKFTAEGEIVLEIYAKITRIVKSTNRWKGSRHPPYAEKAEGQGKHVTGTYVSVQLNHAVVRDALASCVENSEGYLLEKNLNKNESEKVTDSYILRLTYIRRYFLYDNGAIRNVEEVWVKSNNVKFNFNLEILGQLPLSIYSEKRKWEISMENKIVYAISEKKNIRYYEVFLLWRPKVVHARDTLLTRTKLGEILTWIIKGMCNGNDF